MKISTEVRILGNTYQYIYSFGFNCKIWVWRVQQTDIDAPEVSYEFHESTDKIYIHVQTAEKLNNQLPSPTLV